MRRSEDLRGGPSETQPQSEQSKSLFTFEVQLLAGKVLVNTCDAHRGRYKFPSRPRAWKKDHYENFHPRCRGVYPALAYSKALVKSIVDAEFPFIMRFTVASKAELKVNGDNGKLNEKRAESTEEMKKRLRTNFGTDGGVLWNLGAD